MSRSLVDALSDIWEEKGLLLDGRIVPTFIEEVGTASAENTRSAAFKRWASLNSSKFYKWLSDTTETPLIREGCIDREYKLQGVRERVDLVVTSSGAPKAFVEFKWDSHLRFEQLRSYKEIISKEYSETIPLLVVSPFILRETISEKLPSEGITLVDWSKLYETLLAESSLEGNSVEHDFTRTIYRWWSFQKLVKEALADSSVSLGELKNLMLWIIEIASEVKLRDYIGLTGKLIANEIADALLDEPELESWRKCGLGKGANGSDVSCDICSISDRFCFHQIQPGERIIVLIRVKVDLRRGNIGLEIGSAMEPYLGRKQKAILKQTDSEKWNRLHQYASIVRKKLVDEIVINDLIRGKVGNPLTEASWSRNFHYEYADLRSIMGDIPRILLVVRNTLDYMHSNF